MWIQSGISCDSEIPINSSQEGENNFGGYLLVFFLPAPVLQRSGESGE